MAVPFTTNLVFQSFGNTRLNLQLYFAKFQISTVIFSSLNRTKTTQNFSPSNPRKSKLKSIVENLKNNHLKNKFAELEVKLDLVRNEILKSKYKSKNFNKKILHV